MTSSSPPAVHARLMTSVAHYPPAALFGPRRMHDYEFVWLLSGTATWTVTDACGRTEAWRLRPGTLCLARPGDSDSYAFDPKAAVRHGYVHFDADRPASPDWPRWRDTATVPLLGAMCDHLVTLAADPAAADLHDRLLGILLEVFIAEPPGPPITLSGPLSLMIDHVARSWASHGLRLVNATELAAVARVSTGHVFRLFRTELGCAPATAFELVRLARAATTLQRSDVTLAQAAALTGFANAYHFSRRFAQAYGMPPGAFRITGADPLGPLDRTGLRHLAVRLRG